jgi:hypothetical protein
MARPHISPNNREILYVTDSATGSATYVTATGHALDVNASVTLSGSALPISGATTALGVAIVDSSGNQISSFGGTQYADGAARATATGTLMMVDDGANIQSAAGTAAGLLKVDLSGTSANATAIKVDGSAATQPVSGTVAVSSITTSVTPGTGAANLGKAEDSPHTTGDVGVMALAIRNDSGAVSAGADGDYVALTTDATGALRIDLNGTLSTSNSSSSTLLSGAVFTGTSEEVLNYNEIRISVFSNVASASDGLSIQQSTDNSNWDVTDTYTIPAGTGKTYSVPRQARYFRIVYTNGGTNQASFRLQTILNREGSRVSSQRPSDAYTNETDLEQNQAFLMGYNGSTWDRVRTTGTGVLSVSSVLTAGSAIVGKVGIDQTTPGTTNAVSLAQLGATTISTGNGVSGAGVQRVTLASDSTGQVALAAGTNGIGKLTANSGVDIGDVDVTTVGTITPGTAATSLGKAEDAAHTTGDVGVFVLGVRNDTLADVTNTTADYSQASTDLKGRVMTAGAPRALKTSQQTTITSSTTETTVLTAVASTFLDVYGVIVTNTSATVTKVTFKDDTAGTTRFVLEVPATETRGFMLPLDAAHNQAVVNKPWTATCGTSVAAIEITVLAVKMV